MKRIFTIYLVILMFFASCTKVDDEHAKSYTFSVNGTLGELTAEEDTKATLAHTMRMTWAMGDEISVVNLTKGKALGGNLKADKAETTSTFSGVVTGTIDNGDQLALIYPSLGYTQEQVFTSADIDLSTQDGTDNNMKFCVVATIRAETSDNNFVNAKASFFFKSSTINVTLADLPQSSPITKVSFPDLFSVIRLTINSGKNGLDATGVNGIINIIPTSGSTVAKTSSQGTRGMSFGLGGGAKMSSRRTVSALSGEDLYESDMTGGAIEAGKFYTMSVGAFQKKNQDTGFVLNYDNSEMEDGDTVTIGAE